ncbi:hypothetical protein P153DRAFT_391290 [Dothidotthia symphoricarpi CBS 119687]|uniref:Uncharacterized protein n=1 Tax=Dothidotthia symphoricarpi CBS 119687 TaxID=1392245 RepID=A0A6A5ZZE2_9PLEO|nr:uncharacterized protein P153DRAFT_391290 [Dothidotthia symphoricarpi CBS 119687]KAF2123691.1 hypothetical protein P153DRAFT_391290 [Dothidotthia symphoricarpi CBS 119687]
MSDVSQSPSLPFRLADSSQLDHEPRLLQDAHHHSNQLHNYSFPAEFVHSSRYTLSSKLTESTLDALRKASTTNNINNAPIRNKPAMQHIPHGQSKPERRPHPTNHDTHSPPAENFQRPRLQQLRPGIELLQLSISLRASRLNNAFTKLTHVYMTLQHDKLEIRKAAGQEDFATIHLEYAVCAVVEGPIVGYAKRWCLRACEMAGDSEWIVARWFVEVRHVVLEWAGEVVWLAFGTKEDAESWKEVLDELMDCPHALEDIR